MVSDIDTVSKGLPQHTLLNTKGKITARQSRTQLCDQGNEVYFTSHETPDMMNLQTGSTQKNSYLASQVSLPKARHWSPIGRNPDTNPNGGVVYKVTSLLKTTNSKE